MKKSVKQNELPALLRAMAESTRLKMLLMLEAKPRTVGEIVDFFELSQPTITRHLQTLAAAGLVRRARKGQHVLYELAVDRVRMFCTDLVACFPCCCVSSPSDEPMNLQVLEIRKRVPKNTRRRKTASRDKKGETP